MNNIKNLKNEIVEWIQDFIKWYWSHLPKLFDKLVESGEIKKNTFFKTKFKSLLKSFSIVSIGIFWLLFIIWSVCNFVKEEQTYLDEKISEVTNLSNKTFWNSINEKIDEITTLYVLKNLVYQKQVLNHYKDVKYKFFSNFQKHKYTYTINWISNIDHNELSYWDEKLEELNAFNFIKMNLWYLFDLSNLTHFNCLTFIFCVVCVLMLFVWHFIYLLNNNKEIKWLVFKKYFYKKFKWINQLIEWWCDDEFKFIQNILNSINNKSINISDGVESINTKLYETFWKKINLTENDILILKNMNFSTINDKLKKIYFNEQRISIFFILFITSLCVLLMTLLWISNIKWKEVLERSFLGVKTVWFVKYAIKNPNKFWLSEDWVQTLKYSLDYKDIKIKDAFKIINEQITNSLPNLKWKFWKSDTNETINQINLRIQWITEKIQEIYKIEQTQSKFENNNWLQSILDNENRLQSLLE